MLLATWYHNILAILFAFIAVILMGVILLQRGRGVGLAGAFGGAGGNTAFGAKTGDVLTWATMVGAGFLLALACLLNFVFVPLKTTFVAPPTVGPGAAAPLPAEPQPVRATPVPAPAPAAETPAKTTPASDAPATPPGETPAQPEPQTPPAEDRPESPPSARQLRMTPFGVAWDAC